MSYFKFLYAWFNFVPAFLLHPVYKYIYVHIYIYIYICIRVYVIYAYQTMGVFGLAHPLFLFYIYFFIHMNTFIIK